VNEKGEFRFFSGVQRFQGVARWWPQRSMSMDTTTYRFDPVDLVQMRWLGRLSPGQRIRVRHPFTPKPETVDEKKRQKEETRSPTPTHHAARPGL